VLDRGKDGDGISAHSEVGRALTSRFCRLRHKGYRDVETFTAAGPNVSTVVFRFNGRDYVVYRKQVKPIS
jgi:hypothetical protein